MSETIRLKKGLNVPVKGDAECRLSKTVLPGIVAVQPSDFKGLLPRLLVKEGDKVLAGSPVLSDKKNPQILVCAPASGTVKEIVRGEKRKLLAVLIQTEDQQQYVEFNPGKIEEIDGAQVKEAMLSAGVWPWIIQRPYGIIADPAVTPKAIFISAFDSAPLSADADYAFEGEKKNLQAGIDALAKIAKVHVSFNAKTAAKSPLAGVKNAETHFFEGKHPAGNVGVQISNIDPIMKGETVWTVSLTGLCAIGKLFNSGKYDACRKVAVAGPKAIMPSYICTLPGMPMSYIKPWTGSDAEGIRIVSGNILSGTNVGMDGYLGFFDNCITIIGEGTEAELFGWIRPIRYKQFSTDHCYFSWLMPWRKYDMDTNLHGGPRAFLVSDSYYAKVLPMDIYPLFLVKACLAGDIDKMEKFGIYEVLPEDLALCEFVDPSKNNIQEIISKGIDLMLKEMA